MNAKKAYAVWGHINRSIRHTSKEATTPWCSVFVRLLLESFVPFWAPWFRRGLKLKSGRGEHLRWRMHVKEHYKKVVKRMEDICVWKRRLREGSNWKWENSSLSGKKPWGTVSSSRSLISRSPREKNHERLLNSVICKINRSSVKKTCSYDFLEMCKCVNAFMPLRQAISLCLQVHLLQEALSTEPRLSHLLCYLLIMSFALQ